MTNAGSSTVEWLFQEQLKVDVEWSIRTRTGFRWWADKNVQTIEITGQETGPDSEVGYFVSIRAELLRSLELGDREAAAINTFMMPFATMSGPVYDTRSKTLSLASLVRVHNGISHWMKPIIGVAAALQIGEARILGPELAKILHAEEALSAPPGRRMRSHPDEIAEVMAALIAPMGKNSSRWLQAEFQQAVNQYMQGPPALVASARGAGFSVEFPYGRSGSSLCEVVADQPHPRCGNGLFLLQSFPVGGKSDSEGARLALEMNRIELTEQPFGYGFGSYAYRKGTLHFASFFPNALYRPGLLPNIYFTCAQRAQEMSLRLTGVEWTESSFSRRRSALGRIMDHLMGR